MAALEKVATSDLQMAASAWRHQDTITAMHRGASGWLKWLIPEPNYSLHDRIDELVEEIARLRAGR